MTQEKRIEQLEEELKIVRNRLDYIEEYLKLVPDNDELDKAIEAMIDNRDSGPFELYLKRGGKLPHVQIQHNKGSHKKPSKKI